MATTVLTCQIKRKNLDKIAPNFFYIGISRTYEQNSYDLSQDNKYFANSNKKIKQTHIPLCVCWIFHLGPLHL